VARSGGEGGDCGCGVRVEKKTRWGRRKRHLKGGPTGRARRGGSEASSDAWGGAGEREGGPRCGTVLGGSGPAVTHAGGGVAALQRQVAGHARRGHE
jgi:hypothetical protein